MSGKDAPSSIYVAVRIRPFVPREKKAKEKSCVECIAGEVRLINVQTGIVQGFALDELMDSSISDESNPYWYNQEKVYKNLGMRFYNEVKEGFNAALFAYGQTGSGKTTTVVGDLSPPSDRGILPRMLYDLFDYWNGKRNEGWQVDVRVRMLEIYNERIQDLLAPKQNQKKLEVRVHPKLGVYVPDLTINAVESTEECLNLLEYGHTMQTVASTAMNAKSSRAHTIFAMKIEKNQKGEYSDIREENDVFIVDLAGRENEKTTLATGERLVELSFINKSLFHLANCIHALGAEAAKNKNTLSSKNKDNKDNNNASPSGNYSKINNQRDISVANFRNSKLTLLLSEALSGNSKTFMVGTLSPAASAYDENQVTLRFAATVKNIKLKASKVAESKTDQVKQLGDEVRSLKEQLEAATKEKGDTEHINMLKEQLEAAQAMANERNRSWEDARKEAENFGEERKTMLKKLGVQRMKYQAAINKMKNLYEVPLPYISNESTDPFMTGRLQYSFSKGGAFYFGSDIDLLTKHAYDMEDFDYQDGSSTNNCIMIRGLGISAKLCKFFATIDTIDTIETRGGSANNIIINNNDNNNRVSSGNWDLLRKKSFAMLMDDEESSEKKIITLNITRISIEGAVIVNNESLEMGKATNLSQGDKIILGRAHVFRCYINHGESEEKKKNNNKKTTDDNNNTNDNNIITPGGKEKFNNDLNMEKCIRDLLGEDQASDVNKIYLAKVYIGHLKTVSIDQEPKVLRFLYEAKKVKQLVEESNEITTAVRPQDNLRFELNSMAPILFLGYPQGGYVPQMLIRVIRILTPAQKRWKTIRDKVHFSKGQIFANNNGDENSTRRATMIDPITGDRMSPDEISTHEEDVELLFVWSVTKFVGRLDMMRDIYHNWMQGVSFTVDLKEDPWVEAGPVEMDFWVREKEDEKNREISVIQDMLAHTQSELYTVNQSKQQAKEKCLELKKEIGLLNQQILELEKIKDGGGGADSTKLQMENAKMKAKVDTMTAELSATKAEVSSLKKAADAGLGAVESEKKLEKRMHEMKEAFLEEKGKMMDRFSTEKELLKEELEKRLTEFKRKFDIEKKNLLLDAESDTQALKASFEHEKNLLRQQFKSDLETIRNMESEEIRERYAQHEEQIQMLSNLLDAARTSYVAKNTKNTKNDNLNNDNLNNDNLNNPETLKKLMDLSLNNQQMLDRLFVQRDPNIITLNTSNTASATSTSGLVLSGGGTAINNTIRSSEIITTIGSDPKSGSPSLGGVNTSGTTTTKTNKSNNGTTTKTSSSTTTKTTKTKIGGTIGGTTSSSGNSAVKKTPSTATGKATVKK